MENNIVSLNIPDTGKPRVIVIGGGFAGLGVIQNLPKGEFQLVLFDKHNYNTFHPLLYQVATAGLQPDSIAAPLRKEMWEQEDFHFRMLAVQSVDVRQNKINTAAGDLAYDYLILANGSTPNFFGNEEMKQHAFQLKTIPDALNVRSHLMQVMEWANIASDAVTKQSLLNIVLVGGGPTGVEMAGALAELRKHVLPKDYPEVDFQKMNIYLLEGGNRLLAAMSREASEKTLHDLTLMGVEVRLNTTVEKYNGEEVIQKNGDRINSRTVIWTAGVTGNMIEGIPASWIEKGKIKVDPYCRAIGSNNVFAIGDIALQRSHSYPDGLPGVCQPAMQMGKYIGKNLLQLHFNRPVKQFSYFDKGSMATIGRSKAVADFPSGLKISGRIAWYLWLFIHIVYLVTFRHRLLVFANWCWNFITYDKGNRLIIRPFLKKTDKLSNHLIELNHAG